MKRLAQTLAFVAASSAGLALAVPEPIGGVTPWSQTTHLGLEYDVSANLVPNGFAMSWVLSGQVEVVDHLFVGARGGLGYVNYDAGFAQFDQASYSNIPLSVTYAKTVVKDLLAFHVGGRIGIPLLADPESAFDTCGVLRPCAPVQEVAFVAASMEGGWGSDTFLPRYLPIRPGGGVEIGSKLGPGALLGRFDVFVPIFAPLFDNSEGELLFELAGEGEYRLPFGFGGGVRLQSIFSATSNGADAAQVAIEPFVGFFPEEMPFFARLGALVALDAPLGAENGRDPMATFRLWAGWKLSSAKK